MGYRSKYEVVDFVPENLKVILDELKKAGYIISDRDKLPRSYPENLEEFFELFWKIEKTLRGIRKAAEEAEED